MFGQTKFWHQLHERLQTVLSCGKHCITVHIWCVSRVRSQRRPSRLKINVRRNVYASWAVTHSCQSDGLSSSRHLFHPGASHHHILAVKLLHRAPPSTISQSLVSLVWSKPAEVQRSQCQVSIKLLTHSKCASTNIPSFLHLKFPIFLLRLPLQIVFFYDLRDWIRVSDHLCLQQDWFVSTFSHIFRISICVCLCLSSFLSSFLFFFVHLSPFPCRPLCVSLDCVIPCVRVTWSVPSRVFCGCCSVSPHEREATPHLEICRTTRFDLCLVFVAQCQET